MADQLARLLLGADEVIPASELEEKLSQGRSLRIKLGIDPTRPDLHLGHAVVLRTLRRFQEQGHTAVLLIGDYTARVGDPSGRSETRPMLSEDEIESNAQTYLDQAGLVVDVEKAEIRRNSEWLGVMSMADVLALTASTTVAQMLERDDFALRYRDAKPISLVEFLYPLMQAYDSVALEADVELGGTDQKFNLLLGRELQRDHGQAPQVVLTMPLLVGTDGERKMSKSYDNAIALTDEPGDMFGKLMRIPDSLIAAYTRLCTDTSPEDVAILEEGLSDGSLRANDEKRRLGAAVVDLYHGAGAGAAAEQRFNEVFRDRKVPDDIAVAGIPAEALKEGNVWLPRLLAALDLASSNSEARRLITQGGVKLDGEALTDPDAEIEPAALRGKVLQVGRRKFVRLS